MNKLNVNPKVRSRPAESIRVSIVGWYIPVYKEEYGPKVKMKSFPNDIPRATASFTANFQEGSSPELGNWRDSPITIHAKVTLKSVHVVISK